MMILSVALAAALAQAAPAPQGAPPRCNIDFETTLTDLRPGMAIKVGDILPLIFNSDPVPTALAMRLADEVGVVSAGEHLQPLMDCGGEGYNFQAQVIQGANKIRVSLVPD